MKGPAGELERKRGCTSHNCPARTGRLDPGRHWLPSQSRAARNASCFENSPTIAGTFADFAGRRAPLGLDSGGLAGRRLKCPEETAPLGDTGVQGRTAGGQSPAQEAGGHGWAMRLWNHQKLHGRLADKDSQRPAVPVLGSSTRASSAGQCQTSRCVTSHVSRVRRPITDSDEGIAESAAQVWQPIHGPTDMTGRCEKADG
jgi:hypothetical protein